MPDERPIVVLYVDDNAIDARIARRALDRYAHGEQKWEFQHADGLDSAQDVLSTDAEKIAIAVIDYRLGEHNGLELIAHIRDTYPNIPTVMVTGQGDERVAVEAMKAGAYDYIVKDELEGPALGRAVRSAVERAELRQQAEEQQKKLQDMAIRDHLTRLFNRGYFMELLQHEYEQTRRYQRRLSVVMLDLDRFKSINDTHGHAMGDEVLRVAADAIRESLRDADVGGRLGGEEFCVLLPDTDRDGGAIVAERVRAAIAGRRVSDLNGREITATCSAGVASTSDMGVDSVAALLDCADQALLAAKRRGRDQVVLYSRLGSVGGETRDVAEGRLQDFAERFAGPLRDFKSAYIQSVQTLTDMAEAREPGARGHSRQVAAYAMRVARALGLREDEVAAISNAGLLHDVGKVLVPERVLQKPGPLDDEEWAVVRRHPIASAEVLERAMLLADELPAVIHHHEHYDGSGYPHGLSGDRIPLGARIIAIADAYDAMTMGRAYEPRHSQEEAFKVLRRDAGRHFDPSLVNVFIEVTRDKPLEEKELPYAPIVRLAPDG